MKIILIAVAAVVIVVGVLVVLLLVKFGGALADAHGHALYSGAGAWTRVAEFARETGMPHYIAEADNTLDMLHRDLAAWRESAPAGTDFAALEKAQAIAYQTTDANIRKGDNPLAYLDLPAEGAEEVEVLAAGLANGRIFLATEEAAAKRTNPTTTTRPATTMSVKDFVAAHATRGFDITFKSGKDSEGRLWAHAYTNTDRLPPGPSAELSFRHFFSMIDADPQWAGIVLNPGSAAPQRIGREAFGKVKKQLRPRGREGE